MNVIPPRGVLKQVDNTYRIVCFPAVLKPYLWNQIADRIIERQLSLVSQLEDKK